MIETALAVNVTVAALQPLPLICTVWSGMGVTDGPTFRHTLGVGVWMAMPVGENVTRAASQGLPLPEQVAGKVVTMPANVS